MWRKRTKKGKKSVLPKALLYQSHIFNQVNRAESCFEQITLALLQG